MKLLDNIKLLGQCITIHLTKHFKIVMLNRTWIQKKNRIFFIYFPFFLVVPSSMNKYFTTHTRHSYGRVINEQTAQEKSLCIISNGWMKLFEYFFLFSLWFHDYFRWGCFTVGWIKNKKKTDENCSGNMNMFTMF